MNPQQFTIANKEWHTLFSTSAQSELLERIRQELSPNNSEITAELYKFLYYPTGSFFKPHVDTQRGIINYTLLIERQPVNIINKLDYYILLLYSIINFAGPA